MCCINMRKVIYRIRYSTGLLLLNCVSYCLKKTLQRRIIVSWKNQGLSNLYCDNAVTAANVMANCFAVVLCRRDNVVTARIRSA